MNLVDSSGWIEYFTGGPNAESFERPLLDSARLLVPSIVILEVARYLLTRRSEEELLIVVAAMRSGRVVPLDERLALAAARLAGESKLTMADSVILATARDLGATIWTQDAHFQGVPGVRYFKKR